MKNGSAKLRIWWHGAVVVLWMLVGALQAAAAPVPLLEELRRLGPDGRTVPVQGLDLARDAFVFHFESGTFHLLEPVAGRTVGAVFLGEGSYRLEPQAPGERDLLARVAGLPEGSKALEDTFSELVLFFTDDTDLEIARRSTVQSGAPLGKAVEALAGWKVREASELRTDLRLRVLRDLLGSQPVHPGPSFFALVDGRTLPPALAGVDALGADALGLIRRAGSEGSFLYVADPRKNGLWYLSAEKGELDTGRGSLLPVPAEGLSRRVEARLDPPALETDTTLRLLIKDKDVRALPIETPSGAGLQAAFRKAAEAASWVELGVARPAAGARGETLIVFPEPLRMGEEISVRLTTRDPKGLVEAGRKLLQPASSDSWFATWSPLTPVPTDLVFRFPSRFQVAATGEAVEEGKGTSLWRSRQPVWNPGFVASKTQRSIPLGADQYTSLFAFIPRPAVIDPFTETMGIHARLPTVDRIPDPVVREGGGIEQLSGRSRTSSWMAEPAAELLAWLVERRVAPMTLPGGLELRAKAVSGREKVAAASASSPHLPGLSSWFGPLPTERVTFLAWPEPMPTRGWSGLISVPQERLAVAGTRTVGGSSYRADASGIRDVARQWWGLSVQPATYRDRWIEEGLQEMGVALSSPATANRHWHMIQRRLLEEPPGSVPPHRLGAIAEGERLALLGPETFHLLTAGKGGYVFHMLRMLLHEPGDVEETRFTTWLQELAEQHKGGTLSTAELEASLEKHLPAEARSSEGKPFSWFFDQWVRGTEIPRLRSALQVVEAGDGSWRVEGAIRQEDVPPGFVSVVPVYVELASGEFQRIARVRLEGVESWKVDVTLAAPERPRRAVINAFGDVLSRE